jgi:crotonobetainyl-CoA:carnitine CoA-transferase CaiB-like acyl-CoA transferase
MSTAAPKLPPVLQGIRVLDIAHQYSGANAAAILADLGAEVLSIEHPKGSPIRTMLPTKDGDSAWWKVAQRGKKNISLDLSKPKGREIFLEIARKFHVLVENFRPGTLERWRIGPADLEQAGISLALLRISGYGQTGPMRDNPGFGTIAEAMSGFAYMNGFPDRPPSFPSTTLGDGVASIFGAAGVLAALVGRLKGGGLEQCRGVEVIDVALFEALFRIIPTQVAGYDMVGKVPKRPGNWLGDHGVLRNVYRTRDDRFLCISAVGPVAARRILVASRADHLLPEMDAGIMHDKDMKKVQEYLGRCNEHLTPWAEGRDFDTLAADLDAAGAVYSAVYNVEDIVNDAHYQARGDLVRAQDDRWGSVLMQGIVPKFPGRDHQVRHAGRDRGTDNRSVYAELLGYTDQDLDALRRDGIV